MIPVPRFAHRCEALGVPRCRVQLKSGQSGQQYTFQLLGLAKLSAATTYEGPTTRLSREQDMLFAYFRRSQDTIFYNVVDAIEALPGHSVKSCTTLSIHDCLSNNRQRVGLQHRMTTGHGAAYPIDDWFTFDANIHAWANQQAGCQCEDGRSLLMLQVPIQVGRLIVAKSFSCLAVLGRWFPAKARALPASSVLPHWPPPSFWHNLCKGAAPLPATIADFSPATLRHLAAELQILAGKMAAPADDDGELGDADTMSSTISLLTGLADSLDPPLSHGSQWKKYGPFSALHGFIAAWMCRSKADGVPVVVQIVGQIARRTNRVEGQWGDGVSRWAGPLMGLQFEEVGV